MDSRLIFKIVLWATVAGLAVYLLAKYRDTLRTFFDEVVAELKKSAWPTRQELFDSTVIVGVAIFALGVCVAIYDFVFLRIISFLTHLG
jgi:preprotein translocase SecE subunit